MSIALVTRGMLADIDDAKPSVPTGGDVVKDLPPAPPTGGGAGAA